MFYPIGTLVMGLDREPEHLKATTSVVFCFKVPNMELVMGLQALLGLVSTLAITEGHRAHDTMTPSANQQNLEALGSLRTPDHLASGPEVLDALAHARA